MRGDPHRTLDGEELLVTDSLEPGKPSPVGALFSEVSSTRSFPRPGLSAYLALSVLTLVSFVNYMDRMVLAVLLQPIGAELKLGDSQLGLLSGLAFAVLFATLGLPLARLADRVPRLRLLAACLAVWSAMTSVTGLARNFTELFVARMFVGIGEAGCIPAAHSLIGDYFPPRHRALAISVFQAGALAGVSVGLLVTGLIAEHWGWRSAIGIVGALGLPLVLLILFQREPPRQKVATALRESGSAAIAALLRRRAFVHLLIAISLGGFGNYGIGQWLPSFYVRSFGLGLGQVGLLVGTTAALGGIAGVLVGGWAAGRLMARDARWEARLPTIVYSLSAPLYAAVFLSHSVAMATIFAVIANFTVASGGGVALSSMQSFAEPHRRATAVALGMFLSSLVGLGLGPFAVGALSELLFARFGHESLRYALLSSTIVMLWAGAHFHLVARSYDRDRCRA